jgi:hypothetical protein
MEKVLFGTQKWLLLPLGTPVDQPWVKVGGWIVLILMLEDQITPLSFLVLFGS